MKIIFYANWFYVFSPMHLYVNFQMGHLDTLEFSPKTFRSELQAAHKSAPSNPPPQKPPMDTLFALK
jgi:hypothetical protein